MCFFRFWPHWRQRVQPLVRPLIESREKTLDVRISTQLRWVTSNFETATPPKADMAKRSTTVKPGSKSSKLSQFRIQIEEKSWKSYKHLQAILSVRNAMWWSINWWKDLKRGIWPNGRRKPSAWANIAKKTMPRVFPNLEKMTDPSVTKNHGKEEMSSTTWKVLPWKPFT